MNGLKTLKKKSKKSNNDVIEEEDSEQDSIEQGLFDIKKAKVTFKKRK